MLPCHEVSLYAPAALRNVPLLYATEGSEWNPWLSSGHITGTQDNRQYMGNDFMMIEAAVNGFAVAISNGVTCQHYIESGMQLALFGQRKKSCSSFFIIERANIRRKIAVRHVRLDHRKLFAPKS